MLKHCRFDSFTSIFQVYQDGVRNINVVFIFRHVTLPVVCCLLLAVSFPYVTAAGVIPILGKYLVYILRLDSVA